MSIVVRAMTAADLQAVTILDALSFTTPRVSRHRLGEQLFKTGSEAAYAEGARIFHLEVRAGNTAAIRLYEKFGYAVVGRRLKYYKDTGEDALLMTKKVD